MAICVNGIWIVDTYLISINVMLIVVHMFNVHRIQHFILCDAPKIQFILAFEPKILYYRMIYSVHVIVLILFGKKQIAINFIYFWKQLFYCVRIRAVWLKRAMMHCQKIWYIYFLVRLLIRAVTKPYICSSKLQNKIHSKKKLYRYYYNLICVFIARNNIAKKK